MFLVPLSITCVVISRFVFEGWIKIAAQFLIFAYFFEMSRRQRSANAVKAQCERSACNVSAVKAS